jgi:uncharacterized protein YraI
MQRILLATAVAVSFFAAAAASASEGFVTDNVTLRAGPDEGYPIVGMLNGGTGVGIEGCVDGWSWCDVDTPVGRGWMRGDYLQEEYQGRRVRTSDYGMQIGIPFVTFEFGSYWDRNYRTRSWYGERQRYSIVRPSYISIVVPVGSQPVRAPSHVQSAPAPVAPTRVVSQPRTFTEQAPQRQIKTDHSVSGGDNRPMPAAVAPRVEEPRANPPKADKSQNDHGNGNGNDHPKDKSKDKGKPPGQH